MMNMIKSLKCQKGSNGSNVMNVNMRQLRKATLLGIINLDTWGNSSSVQNVNIRQLRKVTLLGITNLSISVNNSDVCRLENEVVKYKSKETGKSNINKDFFAHQLFLAGLSPVTLSVFSSPTNCTLC